MSSLHVGVQQAGGSSIARGAVAEIIPLQADRQRITTLVPVSWQEETAEIPLEAGDWLIRIRLPSGERLSRTVTIREGVAADPVIFDARPSPHEWLTWANYVTELPAVYRGLEGEREAAASRMQALVDDARLVITQRRSGATQQYPIGWPGEPAPRELPPNTGIDILGDAHLVQLQVSCWEAIMPGADPDSLFVVIQDRETQSPYARQIAMLPLPWFTPHGQPLPGQVLILPRQQGKPADCEVRVLVPDEQIGPVLSFLQRGNGEATRLYTEQLAPQAEEYLRAKVVNPYAAAAGAYVLLRLMEYKRLHDWTRNLADWFPWLPDGAIIFAWKRLFCDEDSIEERLAEAQTHLTEAVCRGAPVFTEGVRLLRDAARVAFADAGATRHNLDLPNNLDLLTRVRDLSNWAQPNTIFAVYRNTDGRMRDDAIISSPFR